MRNAVPARKLAITGSLSALALGGAFLGCAAYLGHRITRPTRIEAVTASPVASDIEDIRFQTGDGLTLHGWYLAAPEPRDAIVVCHGFGMERRELLDLALGLRAREHAVLLFDFRGHGLSDGIRSTVGYREAEDIVAAVNYLRGRKELAGREIGVAGLSMGAAAAILAAVECPEIAAVVADSSFATLRGIAARGLWQLYGIPPFPFAPFVVWFAEFFTRTRIRLNRPVEAIARMTPRPLMLIHGMDDRLVPVSDARRLFAVASGPKELWLARGVGHAGAFHADEAGYIERVDRFFSRALGPPAATA